MKKIVAILISIAFIVSLSGCTIPRQLNKTAIVQAIGIDKIEAGFELSFQIYTPKGGRGEIDTSKENSSIITAEGETISQAIANATMVQGKALFIGHNRILIIGEELAKDGIEPIFSYFNTSDKTRENAQVLVAKGSAKDMVSTNIKQGILSAETMESLVDNNIENGYIFTCPYYWLAKNMYMYNGCGVAPVVEKTVEEKPKGDDKSSGGDTEGGTKEIEDISKVKIDTSAVFNNYKMVDILDKNETRGLCFLSDEIQKTVIVVSTEEYKVSVNLYDSVSKMWAECSDDKKIKLLLQVNARAGITEVIKESDDRLDSEEIKKIQNNAEEQIKKECIAAFERTILKDKSDVLYISDLILKSDRDRWLEIKDDFSEHMDELDFEVNVDVEIDKVGLQIP